MDVTDEMLQAAVGEAVKQKLLAKSARGEAEYLDNYERIRAVLTAGMLALPERVPYAWEIRQGARTWLVCSAEFTRSSYDSGSFKPLFDK
jgi:hypothetical protein